MTQRGAGGSVVFDRAADYYDDTRGLPDEVSEQIADRMEAAAAPEARFLELGVGTGRIALPLQRRGRTVVGVDLSVPMMERYRANAAAAGLPRPPLLRGDVSRLPLQDACVGAVIEVHVLHLIPAWRQAPPNRTFARRAARMNSSSPQSTLPIGAPSPFDRQNISASTSAPYSATGVPEATLALKILAPSM